MTHKIRIRLDTDPEEIIQNDPFTVEILIRNIGDSIFPGGSFSMFRMKYSEELLITINPDVLPSIPRLSPNESFTLRKPFNSMTSGVAWLEIGIKSDDNADITYYQVSDSPLKEKNWIMPFIIKNRENYEIITLLQEILKKIDSPIKKPRRSE